MTTTKRTTERLTSICHRFGTRPAAALLISALAACVVEPTVSLGITGDLASSEAGQAEGDATVDGSTVDARRDDSHDDDDDDDLQVADAAMRDAAQDAAVDAESTFADANADSSSDDAAMDDDDNEADSTVVLPCNEPGVVCGVDGQDYANECTAKAIGVNVAHHGACT